MNTSQFIITAEPKSLRKDEQQIKDNIKKIDEQFFSEPKQPDKNSFEIDADFLRLAKKVARQFEERQDA